jgi:hypothetical protein
MKPPTISTTSGTIQPLLEATGGAATGERCFDV